MVIPFSDIVQMNRKRNGIISVAQSKFDDLSLQCKLGVTSWFIPHNFFCVNAMNLKLYDFS